MPDPNVLTTQGDLLTMDPAGTYVRLPRGGDGQVVVLSGGVPSWAGHSGGSVLEFEGIFRNDIHSPVGIRANDLVFDGSPTWDFSNHVYIGEGTTNAGDATGLLTAINGIAGTNKAYLEFWNTTNKQKWSLWYITATAAGVSGGVNYVDLSITIIDDQAAAVNNDLINWRLRGFMA